jgi:hypothetical protein
VFCNLDLRSPGVDCLIAPLINRYWRNRLLRHTWLGMGSLCLGVAIYILLPPPDVRHRISLASAYVAVI